MESQSFPEKDWQLDLDLSSRGRHLLQSGLWADVEFVVGEKANVIKAHRLILASASPVFADMLSEEQSPIRISDVTPENFNLLLESIYTDNIKEVTVERVPELVNLSNKYNVPRLAKACANNLKKNLSPKNAVQCYELATAIKYQPLIDACTKVFRFYTTSIHEAESAVLDASVDTLEFIFSLDHLILKSELDLLTLVEKYANANVIKEIEGDSQKRTIRRLLQKIRFFAVDLDELAKQHQRLRAFLTENELLSLMINYNFEGAAPMPEGFTTNRNRRELSLPFVEEIPYELDVGRVFTIRGTVKNDDDNDVERFNINLRHNERVWDGWDDDDEFGICLIPFHMSVRFDDHEEDDDSGVVVRNSYKYLRYDEHGGWGEQERGGGMPFVPGEQFELTIEIEEHGFKICVNGEHFCSYRHRHPYETIKYISVKGDVDINYLA